MSRSLYLVALVFLALTTLVNASCSYCDACSRGDSEYDAGNVE